MVDFRRKIENNYPVLKLMAPFFSVSAESSAAASTFSCR